MIKKIKSLSIFFCTVFTLFIFTQNTVQAGLASKDYVDRAINNLSTGGGADGGYTIKTKAIQNAAVNDEIYVDMDGIRFRAYKAQPETYWGLRIRNISGGTISASISYSAVYGTAAQHRLTISESLANGAELNPDPDTADVGYGRAETNVGYFFNHTDMHLYRFTISVFIKRAILTVERLH